MREILPFILIAACPLMMFFMMRGHGHGGHAQADPKPPRAQMSLDELKRERDELNTLIGDRAEQVVHSRRIQREAPR
jgi:Protein of unknown function (DUF2933)